MSSSSKKSVPNNFHIILPKLIHVNFRLKEKKASIIFILSFSFKNKSRKIHMCLAMGPYISLALLNETIKNSSIVIPSSQFPLIPF